MKQLILLQIQQPASVLEVVLTSLMCLLLIWGVFWYLFPMMYRILKLEDDLYYDEPEHRNEDISHLHRTYPVIDQNGVYMEIDTTPDGYVKKVVKGGEVLLPQKVLLLSETTHEIVVTNTESGKEIGSFQLTQKRNYD